MICRLLLLKSRNLANSGIKLSEIGQVVFCPLEQGMLTGTAAAIAGGILITGGVALKVYRSQIDKEQLLATSVAGILVCISLIRELIRISF